MGPEMIASPMGPGGTLLFFGVLSALVVPFALLCLPETKGRTLEEITPLFRFKTCGEFRSFVRGNLRSGDGMGPQQAKEPRGSAMPDAQVFEAGAKAES